MKEIIYSLKEAERIRDNNLHLIGKLIYPETIVDKHEELNLSIIEYIEITPADKETVDRCSKIYQETGQWISDSQNWKYMKDEYLVWVASRSNGLFIREINQFLYYHRKESTDYQKLN